MTGVPRGVRFGTAYYAEYQPYDRLITDLDLMVEAKINVLFGAAYYPEYHVADRLERTST